MLDLVASLEQMEVLAGPAGLVFLLVVLFILWEVALVLAVLLSESRPTDRDPHSATPPPQQRSTHV